MYSTELITALHRELQSRCLKATILLGGSYLYGDAAETSDIDFYCVVSFWYFARYRAVVQKFKAEHKEIKCNIFFVTPSLFNAGWYYIYGKTADGTMHATPYNKAYAVITSFKLAAWLFLEWQNNPNAAELQRKALQKIAITKFCLEHDGKEAVALTKAILAPYAIAGESPVNVHQALLDLFEKIKPFRRLWWRTYFLYNLKFLLRGKTLFLLKNPDTMILARIGEALQKKSVNTDLLTWLRMYNFPAIII